MLCIWIEMYVYTKSQYAQNNTNKNVRFFIYYFYHNLFIFNVSVALQHQ